MEKSKQDRFIRYCWTITVALSSHITCSIGNMQSNVAC